MPEKLRKFLFSTPFIAGVGLFALYLAGGFFALPPLVKWQIEKQVPEKLGLRISVGDIHFNPLAFKFELGDLALADAEGRPMLNVKRLLVDFELRSAIDRAWTFSEATLDAPVLHLGLDKSGRHNFAALLDRLRDDKSDSEAAPLPRFVVERIALSDARIDYADRLLAEPLVAHIEPLQLEIDHLSTLPAQTARYRLSAQTAEGESLEAEGVLALNPVAAKGGLKLNGIRVKTLARALARLAALETPSGTIDFGANYELALDSHGEVSGIAKDIDIEAKALRFSAPGAREPLLAVQTLALLQGRVDLGAREVSFARFRLGQGRIVAGLDPQGRSDWASLVPAALAAAPRKTADTSVHVAPAAKPWRVAIASAEAAQIALGLSDASRARSADLALVELSLAASAEFASARTHVALDRPKLSLSGARLEHGAGAIDVANAVIQANRIALDNAGATIAGTIADADIALDGVSINGSAQGGQSGKVSLQGKQLAPNADADTRIAGSAATLTVSGASARLGASTLTFALPDGPAEVSGDGMTVALADVVLGSPAGATPLLRLGSATLEGGTLRLQDRVVSADKLALANGSAQIALDAQGRLNWQSLFPAAPGAHAGAAKSPPSTAQAASAAWRLALKSMQLDGFALGYADGRASPALALGIEGMRARVGNVDTGSTAPMQVELQAKVKSGGQIGIKGEVRAGKAMADLDVNLAGVALAPLQTYLSEYAELRLAAGTVSAAGRLRYNGEAGAGAMLDYKGRISLDRVSLEETEPKRPFLGWDSLASSDLVLTLQPNRIDIGELRIDRPAGRLIIAADQTVNLTDVLKKRKAHDDAGMAASSAPAEQRGAGDDLFPVNIASVRVAGGAFDFADLSLRPQFATHMHELKGVIAGLSTGAQRSARLQLDARVDEYGSAKIRGQMNLLRPQELMEIDVAFRNLEMSSLSPYVAKFAGYRIAAGRLALDLEYKVRDGKLAGENRIVLNQVELGEKVDSPDALDLPLELALAILKDSKGVIKVGLPVSGDLGDPKFDYGAVIGKAIANLLGSIVTAPFRALGALFGGGGKTLDTIDFEPGSDAIAPPERQKLEAVARALKERPALVLVVPPASAPAQDASALKSLAVRSDIVRRMGVELAPGENPGPVDGANPRVQRAIEAALSERYAPEVLAAVKARALAAAGLPGDAAPQSTKLPPEYYEHLVERMIEEEPVSEPMLASLATRRGAAIKRELTTAGGVPAARIVLGEPRAAAAANEHAVTLQLALEAAK